MANLVLCYIDGPWAYFTSQPLTYQWGDDWDDAPYEHNAGPPYGPRSGENYEVVKLAFEGDFLRPHEGEGFVRWSVKDINAGKVAWLRPWPWSNHDVRIWAGTTMAGFIRQVRAAGGKVYLEAREGE